MQPELDASLSAVAADDVHTGSGDIRPARGVVSARMTGASADAPPERNGAPGSAALTERLLEAAVSVFAEYGLEAARVAEIARRAGVTTGAIYGRWTSKSDLLVAAVDHVLPRMLPTHRLAKTGADGIRPTDMAEFLGASLMIDEEGRDVVLPAFAGARSNDGLSEAVSRIVNEAAEQIRSVVAQGKREGFVDPELSTAAVVMVCQAVGLGAQLLCAAEVGYRSIPSVEEWNAVVARLIASVAPVDVATVESSGPAVPGEPSGSDSTP